eukprot:CAMPEP_0184359882 /NCGR_PEP_ID=MMETSP1089-20130417/122263_1 /TAXON_ID=38269 ORGANISM="Gloeochaete wittrockiana, Strain SAG46.84" /NCGR_SAMPLE_ID=MMETSP1089 /ASSEMBLY_ACC=CAM_ASM_000445 /LENGTH=217 /DNA_ID=CAMNT_0026698865 /DNA_START=86 /DNA_END=736 /DNA_ORIENTATION=+
MSYSDSGVPLVALFVTRGKTILAEHYVKSGVINGVVVSTVLEKVPSSPGSGRACNSFNTQVYNFHVLQMEGINFLGVTKTSVTNRAIFSLLDEIATKWRFTYGSRGLSSPPLGMNSEFSRVLSDSMRKFNDNPSSFDKLAQVKNQVDEVKQTMITNMESLLARGEKLELVGNEAELLNDQTKSFQKATKNLACYMRAKNIKLTLMLICLLLIVVYFI